MAEQLGQAVTLFPVRIREAGNGLAAAQAQLELARVNRERCVVRAPFNARVKQVTLEAQNRLALYLENGSRKIRGLSITEPDACLGIYEGSGQECRGHYPRISDPGSGVVTRAGTARFIMVG